MDHHLRIAIVAAGLALVAASPAQAQRSGFNVICQDGTIVPGRAPSTACAGHGGPASIVSAQRVPGAATAPGAATVPGSVKGAPRTMSAPTVPMPIPGGGAVHVWMDASSRIFYCQGDRFYGAKRGTSMTESAAKAAGGRPYQGKDCS